MKRLSLRQFRDSVPDLAEVVEVQRRDAQGNHIVLGYWTPYMTYAPNAKPLEPLRHVEDVDDLGPGLDENAIEPVLPPDRTGMVFAAAKRENKADVGPITGSDIKTAVTVLGKKTPYQINDTFTFHPVPKPARKK